jgi:hypothetical protein
MVMAIPFGEVEFIDFEFRADPGEHPYVWCLTAKGLRSGRTRQWWRYELLAMDRAPFDVSANTLVVAYAMVAEMSCFLELGWPPPEYLLDAYAEFRWLTNGRTLRFGGPDRKQLEKHPNSMLAAAFALGVRTMTTARKEAMRELAMTRWAFTEEERREFMAYNAEDTEILEQIFLRMVSALDWARALIRGRYALAVARMEREGVPIDVALFRAVQEAWPTLLGQLVASVGAAYGVFKDGQRSDQLLLDYARRQGIDWPLTPTGRPMRNGDTMKELAQLHPQLNDLKELYAILDRTQVLGLSIGGDNCNRTGLRPFAAVTARNLPSSTQYVFGAGCWMRSFILAKPGESVAYCDFAAEEIALGAALAGDEALMADYRSGDPYIAFAIRARLAPEGASKASHPRIRELCKVLFLSLNYGRGPAGLAAALGMGVPDAETLMRRHEAAYPQLYRWLRGVVDSAALHRWQRSPFGWRRYVADGFNPRSARNWPCQTLGSELLWLSAIRMTEAGIRIAAPIHDAALVTAENHLLADTIALTKNIMETTSEAVTGGLRIRVDHKTYAHPHRFTDPRGEAMWHRVMSLLQARDENCVQKARLATSGGSPDMAPAGPDGEVDTDGRMEIYNFSGVRPTLAPSHPHLHSHKKEERRAERKEGNSA